jgi:hypothetical protein
VLDARPHGRLLLIVDWADAQIFVNEYERGAGGVVDMTFPPGEYRLMIRVGGSARRYRVRIHPDAQAMLQVNWYTDAAFIVSREWLGFVWPGRIRSREELPEFVSRIVRQHTVHGVLVLGIVRRGGHRYITAQKFRSTTGEYVDGVSIELGEREGAKIKALVGFLADGERSSELLPLVHDPDPSDPRPITPARWPMWAAATTAVGAFAAGGYLLRADGSCRGDACMEIRHTASWGWGAVGVGAAAAAVSTYWYFRSRPSSRATSPVIGLQPRAGGGLLTLSRRF